MANYRECLSSLMLFLIPWKKRTYRGMVRRQMHELFDESVYHKRSLIESGFSSVKRKFGSNILAKKASTIKTEVYGRLICHNLFQILLLRFRTEPFLKLYFSVIMICPVRDSNSRLGLERAESLTGLD